MKFVVDNAIPFIKGVLEPYAEVEYKEGLLISKEDVANADALVIRTRTRCDTSLLKGSRVKMIASASVGVDHIDHKYCSDNGIFVQCAAGCNAYGVMDYVFSALYGTAARKSIDLRGACFGIIGVGNTGRAVEAAARHLGFNVLLCDPHRAAVEGPAQFVSLDKLLSESDIVSLHVPLTEETRGMADADFFSRMKFGAALINSSRGEIVCDEDLMEAIPHLGPVVIDTWNNEPYVDMRLLDMVDIATPHIAGYSFQGKQKATSMVVRAVARYFELKELYDFFPKSPEDSTPAIHLDFSGKTQGEIAATMQYNYPIFTDDFMFRTNPSGFDRLRAEYRYRKEFLIG